MTRDHSQIEELMSVDALGGLDPADRALLDRERAAHGDCDECRRIEAELSEAAAALAISLEPVAVETKADDILRMAGENLSEATVVDMAERRRERTKSWKSLVAVAAALALFVGGWFARDLTAGTGPPRLVRFQGEGGQLAAAYSPSGNGITVFGSDLAPLPEGQVYELWTIEGERPSAAACFTPQDGVVLEFVDHPVGSADLMAVTVESSSCPAAPTTDPVLVAELS